MSRSVIRPTTLPSSITGTAPLSIRAMVRATSAIVVLGEAVATWAVMASLTFMGGILLRFALGVGR